jgi:hypothetical protein
MPNKRPIPLSELLQTGSLADLAAEAGRRESLTERIRSLLPTKEGAHLVAASQSDSGELVLMMDSSVWAARVRFRAEELGTDQLRVRVLPRFD